MFNKIFYIGKDLGVSRTKIHALFKFWKLSDFNFLYSTKYFKFEKIQVTRRENCAGYSKFSVRIAARAARISIRWAHTRDDAWTVWKLTRATADTFAVFLLQTTGDEREEGVGDEIGVGSSLVAMAESRSKRANIWTAMRIHNVGWHSVQLDDSPQHRVTRIAFTTCEKPRLERFCIRCDRKCRFCVTFFLLLRLNYTNLRSRYYFASSWRSDRCIKVYLDCTYLRKSGKRGIWEIDHRYRIENYYE